MPHEVLKVVGGRTYRYVVDRIPDEATGKTRRRWRYVGVAESNVRPAAEPSAAVPTRDRLLAAFERLLAERPLAEVTISAIGREAGLAHGTFYRYFRDRDAILAASLDGIRKEIEATEPRLDAHGIMPTLAAERERVERWLGVLSTIPTERRALLRTHLVLREAAGDGGRGRRARRLELVARFAEYLCALDAAGHARISEPRLLALGIYTAIDGIMLRAIVQDDGVDAETTAALAAIVMRSIFGPAGR